MNNSLSLKPYALASLSGLMLAASFQPFGLWPLAWAALVPLYHAVLRCPDAKSAANLGGWTGLLFYSISLHWMVKIFGPFAFAFWCVFALWLALHTVLFWRLLKRPDAGHWSVLPAQVLLAGILWTGIEYFRAEVWWLRCSWLALGYSQTPDLPMLQTCSLWGIYGLSGLIVSCNAALTLIARGRGLALALAVCVAGLAFWGRHRIAVLPMETGEPYPVALVQDERYDLDRLVAFSLEPGSRESRLTVWPEYSFTVQPGQEESYLKLLAKKLRGTRSVMVVGAAIFPEDAKRGKMQNFAWVLSPEGRLLGRYDKLHPIQYVESPHLPANPAPHPVDTPAGRLGIQICYDLDFEDGSRRMAREGAQLLVAPNLDPLEWKRWQHLQHSWMAPARAVETGLWLVRAASSGFSQAIDPVGRVRAQLPPEKSGVLRSTVYLKEPGTLYTRIGWLTGPACLLATLCAAAWLVLGSRRP